VAGVVKGTHKEKPLFGRKPTTGVVVEQYVLQPDRKAGAKSLGRITLPSAGWANTKLPFAIKRARWIPIVLQQKSSAAVVAFDIVIQAGRWLYQRDCTVKGGGGGWQYDTHAINKAFRF